MSWTSVTLSEFAVVQNGKTPSVEDQRDRGHPVLKIRDVDETGAFRGKFGSFVEQSYASDFEQKRIIPGDTLILNAAHNADYVGSKMYFASEQVKGSLATGEWLIVRPDKERLDAKFTHFWLTSHRCRRKLKDMVKGIHLYPKDVARLDIPLPPLDEQRRIAAILDKADALRRKRKRALDLLESLAEATFRNAFGDVSKWNDVRPLAELADVSSGITKGRKLNDTPTRSVAYMAVSNVQDKRLDLSAIKCIEATEEEILRYRLKRDDLLLTEGGDPDKLGRGTLWKDDIPEAIHQNHIFRVRVRSSDLVPTYLSWLVGSPYGKAYFMRSAKQTTGIASINKQQLSALPVPVPSLVSQHGFVHSLGELGILSEKASRSGAEISTLFASLQHRAFSGQL